MGGRHGNQQQHGGQSRKQGLAYGSANPASTTLPPKSPRQQHQLGPRMKMPKNMRGHFSFKPSHPKLSAVDSCDEHGWQHPSPDQCSANVPQPSNIPTQTYFIMNSEIFYLDCPANFTFCTPFLNLTHGSGLPPFLHPFSSCALADELTPVDNGSLSALEPKEQIFHYWTEMTCKNNWTKLIVFSKSSPSL